jgi:hypothetical protein
MKTLPHEPRTRSLPRVCDHGAGAYYLTTHCVGRHGIGAGPNVSVT